MLDIRDPEIFRTILDSIQTGVYLVDRERKILFWNEGAARITGYQRHEVVGHFCHESILANCDDHGCGLCGNACPLAITIHEGRSKEAHAYFRHKAGHRIPVHVWAVPIRNQHGSIYGAAESFEALSGGATRNRHSSLAAYGCIDEATGIANQSFTHFHLRENLATFNEYRVPFGVVSIQVHRLADFRAAYGREAVDNVLGVIADSVRVSIRPTDFLGRWADDQFLVIALNCNSSGLEKVIQRMRRIVSQAEIQWWGDALSISTIILRTSAQTGDTLDSLLGRVHAAITQPAARSAAASTGPTKEP
jgi:diguanylate cyclase (GGDEF)-like protein/PAS domain S-box-containing protein